MANGNGDKTPPWRTPQLTLKGAQLVNFTQQSIAVSRTMKLQSDVDRVERFRLILRYFDDVSTASDTT